MNPYSDELAERLRVEGDPRAPTFNGIAYGDPGVSGRPMWMEEVERAIGDSDTRISVTLDGLPGGTPDQAFANAYRRGVPVQGSWQLAAQSGNGTAWELAKLGNRVRFGKRAWGDIDFYFNGARLENFPEPDWGTPRKGL